MLNRPSLKLIALAAAGTLAAACASDPAPAGGTAGPSSAASGEAAAAPIPGAINIAATTQWVSDERLMPQQPILALVGENGQLSSQAGFSMTCNPDNGTITARLGKQDGSRIGQSATYRIRLGAEARPVEGQFAASPGSTEADFVFPMDSVALRTIAQLDMVSIATDRGDVQWALVRDASVQVQAKYVASLRGMAVESQNFLVFCNPK